MPVQLTGSIDGGPSVVSDSGGPAATFSAKLAFSNNPKAYNAATGVLLRQLSSPTDFLELDGVGAGKTVPKGTTLYFRSIGGPIDLRLTTDDGTGGDVVAVVPVNGPLVLELPDNKGLKLLEAKGSVQVEYLVTGL